ncbi:DNA polymerase III subunit delta [Terribacillus saccharophilus]|uniref:DNA polymerase III subunit delta n=1 Tax=Terribacillus saccharophilus TaxID=361277 RepID=A0A075LKG8_9BACI|nr:MULTISPECIES: DNA polymerase III subunit delta [Terribacillus]AIF66854.1 DNA polymerase III subunit delta [Terribacillus goriensis]MCM3224430.1 DNA polymerase III subunit delta [Terribacillus saccharophilus]MEC0283674.1 DNA polymerase III subunit delta [Terribacillus saccharophilus]MEC0290630.1 DNA polymerase III subunit delta [Terribacillus saccharophilus]MEC0303460.1 DNA polymerase III subunit delta [Terribacillus saccharophilus]
MSYTDALKAIKKKDFSPIYLLYGTESYFMQDIKVKIEKQFALSDGTNVSVYDLEETPIQEVIADAEEYPFFSEQKLILAYHPFFLKAKPDKSAVDHRLESLEQYVENPAAWTTLVLLAPYEKVDERKKIIKSIKKTGQAVACLPVKEWDLSDWIVTLSKEHQIVLEDAVADLLIQEAGTDLSMLRGEIEKLALYAGEGSKITLEMAESLVSHQQTSSGLKLVDSLMAGDLAKAIYIFHDLIKLKEEPIALIALLASQFRTILHVKLLKHKGYNQAKMAEVTKVHPFVIKLALKREAHFSEEELKHILFLAAETDADMKQGRMEKNLAFELLLQQIVTIRKKARMV